MRAALAAVVVALTLHSLPAAEPDLAGALARLDGQVILRGSNRLNPLAGMLAQDAGAGLRQANQREREAWSKVASRADWEKFRDVRLAALRRSLGQYPPPPADLKVRVSGSNEGDGFRVENLVYESRPGLLATANLYRPTRPLQPAPGIVIVHSHQTPKQVGIRQDMAMTWARAGCLVLVPDHVSHGERRQHPFATDKDYSKPFPPRQDYYHRYETGLQLDLIGDSLMGWIVYDLQRGVDVLLQQPGIDRQRIILISEPAGGGDVAGVAAALDARVAGAMVQNFGGPEPESPYPLPRDAEQSFDFTGSGSWEPTRNLRLSARDGFLPWVIDASIAPRRLIYKHEFYWDREHDPVWQRLQRVYQLSDAADRVIGVAGHGFVVGSAPENSHWLPKNRALLYPILERWFGIPNPKSEYSQRLPEEKLLCLKERPTPVHELAHRLAAERLAAARAERGKLAPAEQKAQLRRQWADLLGGIEPLADPVVRMAETEEAAGIRVERIHLATEPGIVVPVLLLVPPKPNAKLPIVVGVAQAGKQEFLKQRSQAIAALLRDGVAVCLMDVRGTGETSPGGSRDRGGPANSIAASQLMLGQPLLGGRLRDLRGVLRLLRGRNDIDAKRLALWGESFAPVNPANANLIVPHGIDGRPAMAEPLGGLLALLAALFDDDIQAVHVQGGLASFQSALAGPQAYLPHDVVLPAVLTVGDISDLAAALAPRPLRLDSLVDGGNRRLTAAQAAGALEQTRKAYQASTERLVLGGQGAADQWLAQQLKK